MDCSGTECLAMIEEERILRRIPLEIAGLALLMALVSLFFFSPLTSLFILAGGALAALGFVWLKQSISKMFLVKNEKKGDCPLFSDRKKALRSSLLLYGLRLVLILAVFFIIIFLFSRKIIAFAAGFSAILPVFLVEAAIALARMKQWKS